MTENRTYSRAWRQRITGKPVPDSQSERKERTEFGLTVEQLMAASVLDLKKVCPFFFAALCVVPRIESREVGTISVSPDKLYYNSEFLKSVPRPQLSFYLIHGLYHIIMKHHLRGRGCDPLLWNKACDLYINRCISQEFGVVPGEEPVCLVGPGGQSAELQMPESEEFDEDIDIQTDTPEAIYLRLRDIDREGKPRKEEGESDSGSKGYDGKDGKQGKAGYGDEGASGEDQQEGRDESEQPKQEKPDALEQQDPDDQPQDEPDDTPNADQDNPSNDQGGPGETDAPDDSDGQGQQAQPGQQPQSRQEQSAPDAGSGQQENLSGAPQEEASGSEQRIDLIDDADSVNASQTSMGQKANRLLQKIETTHSQIMQNTYGRGTTYDKVAKALVRDELVPRVDWRVLLQNRLVAIQLDEKSLSHPDRRFVHRGLYLEGAVVEEELLTDIKICVDTSASMSDEDVAIALRQISQLLRQYKLKADLVFWDEEVEAIVPFTNQHGLNLARKQAMGRGGTNPNCLFELFSSRSSRGFIQKKPKLLLIFTDGYFAWPKSEYRKAFDRDTIWILSAQEAIPLEQFQPGFGRVARMRTEGWKNHGT